MAGLPNPQEDHAVRMTKFSHECVAKMSLVVRDLSETLGEDTADLQLRVGLHSGPVTAGVLRGGKTVLSVTVRAMVTQPMLTPTLLHFSKTQPDLGSSCLVILSIQRLGWKVTEWLVVSMYRKQLPQNYLSVEKSLGYRNGKIKLWQKARVR